MNVREKGMQKRMLIVTATVAAVAIAVLALILALNGKDETYRSIKIIELDGGVTIEREGVGVLEASSNMNLISGDAVKTEQNAYAVLQLDSDKYVMLAESGSMTVVAEGDEANGRTAIRLDSGSVLNEIQNPLSNGSSYDIVTPNATMSVRGTVFEVRKNGDDNTGNIEVLVYDGKVAVGLDGAEPALYEAGEYTQFTAGQDPQFIVEREVITEENLNPQFMKRLEQINSQSRELNLGTALLASAQTQGEVSAPQQTPAVSEPVETPSQTAAPSQTSAPSQEPKPESKPTAVQVPVNTSGVQNGGGAANVTVPNVPVTEDPAGDTEDQDEDRDDEDRKEEDDSGSVQQPDGSTGDDGKPDDSGNTGNEGKPDDSGNTGNEG
ncbi:MAG: FecR domain-containing protein [Acetatifactor sp.]|nr:FecR domain-containing protein [Acetatifactor sp.]